LRANAFDRGLELVHVELGEHLARFHRTVVVDQDLADGAGQFAGDVDLGDRLRRPGGGDEDGQVAARDRLRSHRSRPIANLKEIDGIV
jgi:hypothetical protein